MRIQVLTVVRIQVVVFRVMISCNIVQVINFSALKRETGGSSKILLSTIKNAM
jgi:hypothetical protein